MRNRILSLMLAALIVLTAVPVFALSVGAAEREVAFEASFYEDKDITYDEVGETVSYNGPWSVGIVNDLGGFTTLPRLRPAVPESHDEHGILAAITEFAHGQLKEHENWGMGNWGTPPGSGGYDIGANAIFLANHQTIPAYVYTVDSIGSYNIYPRVTNFTAPTESVDNEGVPDGLNRNEYYIAILVNEKMVWPYYEGDISYGVSYTPFEDPTGSWYPITMETTEEELNEALSQISITVKEGDRIEFAFRNKGTLNSRNRIYCYPAFEAVELSDTELASKYAVVKQDGKFVSSVVARSATVEAPEYTGDGLFIGWDTNGDGIADCMPGDQVPFGRREALVFVTASSVWHYNEFLPTYNTTTGKVGHPGSWKMGRYTRATGRFDLFSNGLANNIISAATSPWGNTGGGYFMNHRKVAMSGCMPDGQAGTQNADLYNVAIVFTSVYNGRISLDFDKLMARRELNTSYKDDSTEGGYIESYISYGLAVYKNNEKIWPADTDRWTFVSDDLYTTNAIDLDMLEKFHEATEGVEMTVSIGDEVSVRLFQEIDHDQMIYCEPVITYTELHDTPDVRSTSVTIGEDLDLNIFVNLNPAYARPGAKAGLICWTAPQTSYDPATGIDMPAGEVDGSLTKFTYEGLAAKQMADVIYCMPYSYLEGDSSSRVYGSVVECSIAAYAENAFGLSPTMDEALIALLNYGAAAQNYFDYNRDNLANECLTEDQKVSPMNNCTSVWAQSKTGTNGVNIWSASLVLGGKIGLKMRAPSKPGVTATLQVSRTADFAEYTEIPAELTISGGEYRATYYVDNDELGTTFYFRFATGTTYGNVMTYSVDSYVARMSEKEISDALYYLIEAIGALSAANA